MKLLHSVPKEQNLLKPQINFDPITINNEALEQWVRRVERTNRQIQEFQEQLRRRNPR